MIERAQRERIDPAAKMRRKSKREQHGQQKQWNARAERTAVLVSTEAAYSSSVLLQYSPQWCVLSLVSCAVVCSRVVCAGAKS
jgi:hypothetical protein